MFKYSYRVALNTNPEVLRLTNNKIHSKNIASQALQLHITVQCSWLQPERAALSVQLCQSLPACPECVLAAPVLVGDWAFVSWMLQMCWWEELWEEGLAHSRKVGGVCSAELAVHSPCSCSHLCSCSAHLGCSAAVPQLLFEQNRVTPSWESTDKPTLLWAIVLWMCLCSAQEEHTATCKQPHTGLSTLFTEKLAKHGNRPMPGRVPKTCKCGTVGTWLSGGFSSAS